MKELPAMLQETHVIRAHECGHDRCLKLHSLLDYLQDIAANHAELLGIGMDDLAKTGTIWVLSRLKLSIRRYPQCDEKIQLTTYPTGVNKLFATREYVMTDEAGEILVCGTSYWLVIDAKSYRPMKAAAYLPDAMSRNEDKERYFPEIGKIVPSGITAEREKTTVRHADIDMNRHLNNAVFARHLLNILSDVSGSFVKVGALQINFMHAGALGDTLCFGAAVAEDGKFYADALSEDGKLCYIQAEGTLLP